MSSDYERIRNDNLREYGEGTRHLAFLSRLYTDRTHFLFELLQNAEDARAKSIRFHLFRSHLEVWHDGRPFDERDVRGICGIGEGTKADDLTQIGKFGIGFKSVYGYTTRPEIHSGDEHFHIDHYVRPAGVPPRQLPHPWTTLFIFPFQREDIASEQAFEEIGKRLQRLNARTLMFLRSINEIEWQIAEGADGIYLRETRLQDSSRHVKVIGQGPDGEQEEEWLIFERLVDGPQQNIPISVEAAFRLITDETTNSPVITRTQGSNLVVFFPTEKETHLGFLIQGPYRTTPARDNVPPNDSWNRKLIQETTRLIVEILPNLRDKGLISVDMLESLPLRERDFPLDSMFRPIFEGVRAVLRDQALLPVDGGGFVAAKNAKLARSTELIDLLASAQLTELFSLDESAQWLLREITPIRTSDLYNYLIDQRGFWFGADENVQPSRDRIEIRPETVVSALTSEFLEARSDDWIRRFYGFLAGQKDVWKLLRDKAFLRLEVGAHVKPFREDGSPNAYLPPSTETVDFPVVKRDIASDEDARRFLVSFGLREPDIVADIIENVLHKYAAADLGELVLSSDEHESDVRRIFVGLETAAYDRLQELVQHLKDTPFMRAVNGTTTQVAFVRPSTVYRRTLDLEVYFTGNSSIWFLDDPAVQSWSKIEQFLSEFGVEDVPRLLLAPEPSGDERIEIIRWLLENFDGFTRDLRVTDYELDGLEHFLSGFEGMGIEQMRSYNDAEVLWKLLLKHLGRLEYWERKEFGLGRYRWFYRTQRGTFFQWARWIFRLRAAAWLPSRDGTFHKPEDVTVEELPEGFDKDDILIITLGIGSGSPHRVAKFAQEEGYDPGRLDFLLWLEREHPDVVTAWERKYSGAPDLPPTEDDSQIPESTHDLPDLDYVGELRRVFARPQLDEGIHTRVQRRVSPQVEGSREQVREDIERTQSQEPRPEQRFARVPRKVWEAKSGTVRAFLLEEYGGRCQICASTFVKRDGDPYFEGLYLASRTHAKWIERPGNALCLCPTCTAMFLYGSVEAEDIIDQIQVFRDLHEGGKSKPILRVQLCGEEAIIRFTERHMVDLQELMFAVVAAEE